MLERLFRSKSRAAVLKVLALNPAGVYVREAARKAGVQPIQAQRELEALAGLGLADSERKGNQRHFRFARGRIPSLLAELGATDAITEALAASLGHVRGVELCFVFGSVAAGQETAKSDVDVFIIGKPDMGALSRRLKTAEETIGRQVRPVVEPESEFRKNLAGGNHFLKRVLAADKWFVIGDEDKLANLAGTRLD